MKVFPDEVLDVSDPWHKPGVLFVTQGFITAVTWFQTLGISQGFCSEIKNGIKAMVKFQTLGISQGFCSDESNRTEWEIMFQTLGISQGFCSKSAKLYYQAR